METSLMTKDQIAYEARSLDLAVKIAAERLYNEGSACSKVAEALKLPEALVQSLARQGGWEIARKARVGECMRATDDAVRQLMADHRVPEMRRQLERSNRLAEVIMQKLDQLQANGRVTATPNELKSLADALEKASNIAARVLAFTERPVSIEEAAQLRGARGITVNFSLPQVPVKEKSIDAEVVIEPRRVPEKETICSASNVTTATP